MQFRVTHLPLKMNLTYPNLPSAYTKNEFITLIKINEHELNLCFLFSLNIMKLIDVILTFNYVYQEATFFSILKKYKIFIVNLCESLWFLKIVDSKSSFKKMNPSMYLKIEMCCIFMVLSVAYYPWTEIKFMKKKYYNVSMVYDLSHFKFSMHYTVTM